MPKCLFRFGLALVASVALSDAAMGGTWRPTGCDPQPDPAAVAARDLAQKRAWMAVAQEGAASENAAARELTRRNTRTAAVGGVTALAIGLAVFGWNWVRDTRAALAYRRRELTPWERAEQEM